MRNRIRGHVKIEPGRSAVLLFGIPLRVLVVIFCALLAACGTAVPLQAGSALTSFFNPSGNYQHMFYQGADQHVYQVYFDPNSGWHAQDMTATTGAAITAPGSALTSFFNPAGNYRQMFYEGADQHIHQIYYAPTPAWYWQDVSVAAGAAIAAPGSALTSFFNPAGNLQQVFYEGTNQHVYQIYFDPNSGWHAQDVTAAAGAPSAASGSALTSFFNPAGNVQQVFYEGVNQHLYQIYFDPNSGWHPQDVTAAAGAPSAASGSALTSFFNPAGNVQQVFYEGANQHVYQMYFDPNSGWHAQDLTAAVGAAIAATGSALTSFFNPAGNLQQVFYEGANQHVYQMYFDPNSGWHAQDVTAAAGAPSSAFGSPLTSFSTQPGIFSRCFMKARTSTCTRCILTRTLAGTRKT